MKNSFNINELYGVMSFRRVNYFKKQTPQKEVLQNSTCDFY